MSRKRRLNKGMKKGTKVYLLAQRGFVLLVLVALVVVLLVLAPTLDLQTTTATATTATQPPRHPGTGITQR